MKHEHHSKSKNSVELPTPTAWPIVTAFGLTLFFFAFVTHFVFAIAGVLVGLVGAVGWCFDLFPHPKHEAVPIRPPSEHAAPIRTAGRVVRILEVGRMSHRARIPVEVHPYTAGAFGGLGRCGGHGRAGVRLRHLQIWEHLVSHQPPGSSRRSGVSRSELGDTPPIQFFRSGCRLDRPHIHLHPRGPSLCSASSDVAGALRVAVGWNRDPLDLDRAYLCFLARH